MSLNDQQLKLLENIGALVQAIDDEVDWYIAYFQEKDKSKKSFYFSIFLSKQEKRIELAKELSNEQ